MLAALGWGMIAAFMILIMTRALSAVVALLLIPIAFGLLAGHGTDMGAMAMEGLSSLAPTAATLVFAVLYFGIMIDAGLFDPLVRGAIRFAKGDPLRVCLATATVAALVSLDGDGASTAIVTIGAFLPIYRRLEMNPLILALLMASANSVLNLTPWGGPVARVASALQVDIAEVFVPLIPTILVGLAGTFIMAWVLGLRERRRLGVRPMETEAVGALFEREPGVDRPGMFWINLVLTLALLACAITQFLELPIAFMVGLGLALLINYPRVSQQRERIAAHAPNVLPIALLIFAAAVFTGILNGTGMVEAIGQSLLALIPESMGRFLGPVIALMSGPFTFVMSNDAYYFGIVPVIAETADHFGIGAAEVARASVLGQTIHTLSPLIAAIYLVAGLLKVEVGDLQRFALPFALILYLLMVGAALATGAVPFRAH